MLDIHLRELKDALLLRLLWLVPVAVSPNMITLCAFVVGLASAASAAGGSYTAAQTLWICNRILDGLDGAIARARGSQSLFGGYLDIVTDFTVYALIPIGCVVGQATQPGSLIGAADGTLPWAWLALALMEGAFFVNAASLFMLSAILEHKSARASARELTTVTMPPGLVEGSETIFVFSLFLLLPASCTLLFAMFTAAVGVTVMQRLLWAARNL